MIRTKERTNSFHPFLNFIFEDNVCFSYFLPVDQYARSGRVTDSINASNQNQDQDRPTSSRHAIFFDKFWSSFFNVPFYPAVVFISHYFTVCRSTVFFLPIGSHHPLNRIYLEILLHCLS